MTSTDLAFEKSTFCRNRSALLFFSDTFMIVGDKWLSTATSAGVWQAKRSMSESEATVNSPACRNAKKHNRHPAAHSILVLKSLAVWGPMAK